MPQSSDHQKGIQAFRHDIPLDGLRGVAILTVVLFHCYAPHVPGYLGVDIFFVISGYLITSILVREYIDRGTIEFRSFLVRRAFRLLPALVVVCIAFALYASIIGGQGPSYIRDTLVQVLTFTIDFRRAFGDGVSQYLGHTWSLAIEVQFYIIWPATMIGFLYIRSRSRSVNSIALIAATLILASVLWRSFGFEYLGFSGSRIYNAPDTHMDGLFVGSFLACAKICWPDKVMKYAAYFFVYSISAYVFLILGPADIQSRWTNHVAYFLTAISTATIIASLDGNKILHMALSAKVLVWFGKRSYSLYLWHVFLWDIMSNDFGLTSRLFGMICMIISTALSDLSYRWIERPFISLGKSSWRARPA